MAAQAVVIAVTRFLQINLGLLAIVIVAAAYLLLTSGPQAPAAARRVTDIDTTGITRITVQRTNNGTLQFRREGEAWTMSAPILAAANPARINAMLYLPRAQSFAQLDRADLDLQQAGLNDPMVVLSLDDAVFTFGSDNPMAKRRYVLHDGTVHLVNDNLYYQLLQPPEFFLDNGE